MDALKIIDDIILKEGGFVDNKADKGGPTNMGITLPTLSRWRGTPVGIEDIRNLKRSEASDIYYELYIKRPKLDQIPDPHLRAQLVDFGVNSGPMLAITKLQTLLGVEADGVLGSETLSKLALKDQRVINNLLMAERVRMLGRIVTRSKTQIAFLDGWLARALTFLR